MAEKIIDDWLTEHDLEHEKEISYPNSSRRADWGIGNTYIEYVGVSVTYNHPLNQNYYKSLVDKRGLCAKYNLKLIELYPEDLNNLGAKLGILFSSRGENKL